LDGFILLRPEMLSRYVAAVVRKVRKHPQEMGCIREDELLAGDLDYEISLLECGDLSPLSFLVFKGPRTPKR
jgi:hypothetical protein